jgi:hypothetical protein
MVAGMTGPINDWGGHSIFSNPHINHAGGDVLGLVVLHQTGKWLQVPEMIQVVPELPQEVG